MYFQNKKTIHYLSFNVNYSIFIYPIVSKALIIELSHLIKALTNLYFKLKKVKKQPTTPIQHQTKHTENQIIKIKPNLYKKQ